MDILGWGRHYSAQHRMEAGWQKQRLSIISALPPTPLATLLYFLQVHLPSPDFKYWLFQGSALDFFYPHTRFSSWESSLSPRHNDQLRSHTHISGPDTSEFSPIFLNAYLTSSLGYLNDPPNSRCLKPSLQTQSSSANGTTISPVMGARKVDTHP